MSSFSNPMSRKEYRRFKRAESAIVLHGHLKMRRRAERYAHRCLAIVSTLPVVSVAVETIVAEDDTMQLVRDHSAAENRYLAKCAEYRRLRHTLNRLTILRAAKLESEQLETVKKFIRRNMELHTTPIKAEQTWPIVPVVEWESLGVELCALLDAIEDKERRFDVAAQCVLVKAEFPYSPAASIVARAKSICRNVAKGRYADGNDTISADCERGYVDAPVWAMADDVAYTDWLSLANDAVGLAEQDRLQLVAESLDPVIVAGLREGMTQSKIAEMIGKSQSYVATRIAAVRDSVYL